MNLTEPTVITTIHNLSHQQEVAGEQELSNLLTVIKLHVSEIINHISNLMLSDHSDTSGMCLESSRFSNNILSANGFDAKILQGDIRIGDNDWLEHNISLIRLTNVLVTIDFTANQLARFSNVPFVIIINNYSMKELSKTLNKLYDWWVPQ